jgi:hypothetical protein
MADAVLNLMLVRESRITIPAALRVLPEWPICAPRSRVACTPERANIRRDSAGRHPDHVWRLRLVRGLRASSKLRGIAWARPRVWRALAPGGCLRRGGLAERACWYARLVTGSEEVRFADDDPEYATDAAAEIDVEAAAFGEDDPKDVPADMGDSGTAEPPGGGG